MRNFLSLAASFLALHATHALPSASSDQAKAVEDFERGFHNSLHYQFTGSIRLIGYKKISIPEAEKTEFQKYYQSDVVGRNESNLHHSYFDAASSTLRVYFPVEHALLKNDKTTIEATDLGELNVKKVVGDYAVLGRRQTDKVTGVKGNTIKNGIIYLNPPVKPARNYDGKIFVYDFGVKSQFHSHLHGHGHGHPKHPKHHAKRSWWNPFDWIGGADAGDEDGEEDGTVGCYANHGKKTCSKQYNIHHGRCKYSDKVCMDYNGWGTDCKNAKKNFLGSDCYTAMSRGHCWNEVM